eukprot:349974-Chlamydomonas_euryale.AAC.2
MEAADWQAVERCQTAEGSLKEPEEVIGCGRLLKAVVGSCRQLKAFKRAGGSLEASCKVAGCGRLLKAVVGSCRQLKAFKRAGG